MARRFPKSPDLIGIPLRQSAAGTIDAAAFGYGRVPSTGKVVAIDLGCDLIGGDVSPTGLGLKVTAKTGVAAARELMASRAAVVASSAIVAGGLAATLTATKADLRVTEGDVLTLDADVTGGTNPTFNGCWAMVYISPDA